MLFYHSVSYNFFTNFFGLERGLNLRSLGEMQGLNPLRHSRATVASPTSAQALARVRARKDVVCIAVNTMYSRVNLEIFSRITGSRTRDVCSTVVIATPMTTIHRV